MLNSSSSSSSGVPRTGVADVVVAAWNRADTIERTIRSALAQAEVAKVIVVDDASTDGTASRVKQIVAETDRVILRCLSSNSGPSIARNAALNLSTAEWVAIVDGDDFLLPGRMKKLLEMAEGFDFVLDDQQQIEERVADRTAPLPSLCQGLHNEVRLNFEAFVLGNLSRPKYKRRELGVLKPIMRREFLDRHGLRYEDEMRLGEDYALYASALAHGARFLLTPFFGYVAVVRPDSLSGRHSRHDLERLRDFDLQLAKIVGLSRGDRKALRRHYQNVDGKVQWLSVIDAVKNRKLAELAMPFCRSLQVSLFLTRQLLSEFDRRFFIKRI